MSEIKTNKISPRKGTTTTITDSGDTVTVSSGANINNAGNLTISNLTNSGTITSSGTLTTAGISGSGTINNTTGTISGLQGAVNWQTGSIKTTAFTASANEGYFCNTTSAAFTVTLPASPSAGDVIGLKDYADTFDTNNLTINANGNKIQGSTTNFIISVEGTAAILLYVDSTKGWLLVDQSKAADISQQVLFTVATGGTITEDGDFKIHTFTGPGTFNVTTLGNGPTVPTGGPSNVDYLVVAGGGAGGNNPGQGGTGGGGAGGHRTTFPSPGCNAGAFPISATAYSITVGAGGTDAGDGTPGSPSIFSTITSAGGGEGGYYGGGCVSVGDSGGSGGGGGPIEAGGPGAGGAGNTPPVSPSQGNPGGTTTGDGGANSGSGGGGIGGSGSGAPGPSAGAGGNGTVNSINGSSVTRAGGGGGGSRFGTAASGGSGGGGNGATGCGVDGGDGSINTGSGGGGSGRGPAANGGAGGSGIVIIRYKFQ